MKKIILLIKHVVLSFLLIYSYNMMVSSFNLNISVNAYSITTVSLLGFPGLISMVILKMLIK